MDTSTALTGSCGAGNCTAEPDFSEISDAALRIGG
jgi:hypothetical protein